MGIMRFRPVRVMKKFLSTTYTTVTGKKLLGLYATSLGIGTIVAYLDVATAPLFEPLSLAYLLGL